MKKLLLALAFLSFAVPSSFCSKNTDSLLGSFSGLPTASQSRILDSVIHLIDRRNAPWATSITDLNIPLTDDQQLALYTPEIELIKHSSVAAIKFSTHALKKRIINLYPKCQF